MESPEKPEDSAHGSWTDPVRRRWEAIPSERRRDLNRGLGLLPGSFGRWRGLLEAGLTHVRLTTGNRRRVAILGAPNAGKSTLYNRLILARRDQAEVGPSPGTTRLAQEGDVGLFSVVDTPGADASASPSLRSGSQLSAGPDPAAAYALAMDAARQADVRQPGFEQASPSLQAAWQEAEDSVEIPAPLRRDRLPTPADGVCPARPRGVSGHSRVVHARILRPLSCLPLWITAPKLWKMPRHWG